jgi:hypothetical protein
LGNESKILDKKVGNMEEKFSKEMEILNHNQVEKLQMKTSIRQIKTTTDSIISRPGQVEEYQT